MSSAKPNTEQLERHPGGIDANNKLRNYKVPTPAHKAFSLSSHEEVNAYQSASVLMKAISDEALSWKNSLPENFRPAVLAVLHGGIQIHVESLSKISFNGIRIAGLLNGGPCAMLAHQSTVQLLCYGQEITQEDPKNPIGFIWDDMNIEV